MGKWLSALRAAEKQSENATNRSLQNPQNFPNRGFEGFEGSPPGQLPNYFDLSGWDELDWQIAYDERAAILEHDEGLPRHIAARLARRQIDEQRQRKWH